jgi:hypothetical protein
MPKKFVNGEESTYKSILSEGLFIKAEQSAIMKRLSEFSTTIEDIDDAFICAHIVRTELNGLKRNIDYAKSKQQQIRDVSVQGPLLIENIRLRMFLSMHYPMWITTYNMGVSKLTKLNKLVDEYIKDGIANNILHKCEVCSKIQKASICTSCNP